MYQIAVCDDEEAIRTQIIQILAAHPQRDAFGVTAFPSGEALLESLRAAAMFLSRQLEV